MALPNPCRLAIGTGPPDPCARADTNRKRPRESDTERATIYPPMGVGVDYGVYLDVHGFVVLPTALVSNAALRNETRQAMDKSLKDSPEIHPCAEVDRLVLGGFSALAHPSSFHAAWPRKMREQCTAAVLESGVFTTGKMALAPHQGLEKTFDRLMVRAEGKHASPETMHRDKCYAKFLAPGDVVYGGWINLDDRDQWLSCCPGSHMPDPASESEDKRRGFAKLSPDDKARYEPQLTWVRVAPGGILVFNELLVHEVVSIPAKETMRRMHLGWRVTTSEQPIFGRDATLGWINDQAVPKIKSGQDPLMWPALYKSQPESSFPKVIEWTARTFVEGPNQLLRTTYVSNKDNECRKEWHGVVPAKMPSLRALGMLHDPYDEHERALLFPRRSWSLRTFESPTTRKEFTLPPPTCG